MSMFTAACQNSLMFASVCSCLLLLRIAFVTLVTSMNIMLDDEHVYGCLSGFINVLLMFASVYFCFVLCLYTKSFAVVF